MSISIDALSVCDPLLGTIDDPFLPVLALDCRRLQAHHVAASLRL